MEDLWKLVKERKAYYHIIVKMGVISFWVTFYLYHCYENCFHWRSHKNCSRILPHLYCDNSLSRSHCESCHRSKAPWYYCLCTYTTIWLHSPYTLRHTGYLIFTTFRHILNSMVDKPSKITSKIGFDTDFFVSLKSKWTAIPHLISK